MLSYDLLQNPHHTIQRGRGVREKIKVILIESKSVSSLINN